MSSIPVLDRPDADCDGDQWTDMRSPRLPRFTASDVRSAIAAAQSRHLRGVTATVEVDTDSFGGRDPELAVDIQRSVADFWDR